MTLNKSKTGGISNWIKNVFFSDSRTTRQTVVAFLAFFSTIIGAVTGIGWLLSNILSLPNYYIFGVYLFVSLIALSVLGAICLMIQSQIDSNEPTFFNLEAAQILRKCFGVTQQIANKSIPLTDLDAQLENTFASFGEHLRNQLGSTEQFHFTIKEIPQGNDNLATFFRDKKQSDRDNTPEPIKNHYFFDCFRNEMHKKVAKLDCIPIHDINLLPPSLNKLKERAHAHSYSTTLAFPLLGKKRTKYKNPPDPELNLDMSSHDVHGFFSIDTKQPNVFRPLFDIASVSNESTNCGENHSFRPREANNALFLGLSDFLTTIIVLKTLLQK